jgi:spore coat protein U-like protein
MIGSGADTVVYSLYQGSCCATVWGETIGVDTMNAVADGTAQNYTVFGRVPVQPTPPPDTYSDTITVTMTF